jgi:hypothetical protein
MGQVGEVVEPLQLELALRLLRCPILEKRLYGLGEITDMATRAGRMDYFKYDRWWCVWRGVACGESDHVSRWMGRWCLLLMGAAGAVCLKSNEVNGVQRS